MKQQIIILDNGGATFDRYTIIDRLTGDMAGLRIIPFILWDSVNIVVMWLIITGGRLTGIRGEMAAIKGY